MRRELGDFQTPSALVTQVLQALGPIGGRWPRVLEPTCGSGQFIHGLLEQRSLPREIQAIEIQQSHWQAAQELIAATASGDVHVELTHADLFSLDLSRDLHWSAPGPLLVIGNPPWVTNSELGRLASPHRPPRRNVKGLPRAGGPHRLSQLRRRRGGLAQADLRARRSIADDRAFVQDLRGAERPSIPAARLSSDRRGVDPSHRRCPLVPRGRRRLSILRHVGPVGSWLASPRLCVA